MRSEAQKLRDKALVKVHLQSYLEPQIGRQPHPCCIGQRGRPFLPLLHLITQDEKEDSGNKPEKVDEKEAGSGPRENGPMAAEELLQIFPRQARLLWGGPARRANAL